MARPTKTDNDAERLTRIESMVKELAAIEDKAQRIAAEVREKAAKIAAEVAALKKKPGSRQT
jgi:hypothetical protein